MFCSGLLQANSPRLCVACADPFKNDVNFFLCMLALEELGATGNKVRLICKCGVVCFGCGGVNTSMPLACND